MAQEILFNKEETQFPIGGCPVTAGTPTVGQAITKLEYLKNCINEKLFEFGASYTHNGNKITISSTNNKLEDAARYLSTLSANNAESEYKIEVKKNPENDSGGNTYTIETKEFPAGFYPAFSVTAYLDIATNDTVLNYSDLTLGNTNTKLLILPDDLNQDYFRNVTLSEFSGSNLIPETTSGKINIDENGKITINVPSGSYGWVKGNLTVNLSAAEVSTVGDALSVGLHYVKNALSASGEYNSISGASYNLANDAGHQTTLIQFNNLSWSTTGNKPGNTALLQMDSTSCYLTLNEVKNFEVGNPTYDEHSNTYYLPITPIVGKKNGVEITKGWVDGPKNLDFGNKFITDDVSILTKTEDTVIFKSGSIAVQDITLKVTELQTLLAAI